MSHHPNANSYYYYYCVSSEQREVAGKIIVKQTLNKKLHFITRKSYLQNTISIFIYFILKQNRMKKHNYNFINKTYHFKFIMRIILIIIYYHNIFYNYNKSILLLLLVLQ